MSIAAHRTGDMEGQGSLPLSLPPRTRRDAPAAVEFRAPRADTPRYTVVPSPIGELLLVGDGTSLTAVHMLPDHRGRPLVGADWRAESGAFATTVAQLRAYFAGDLRAFDLPLAPHGTQFQRMVWQALTTIPYGETATYGEIAAWVGRPSASRAVGMANGRNPIPVIVPCHRVIGADGTLTGYGGGLQRKEYLLSLERQR